jgi:hypothetical protein
VQNGMVEATPAFRLNAALSSGPAFISAMCSGGE